MGANQLTRAALVMNKGEAVLVWVTWTLLIVSLLLYLVVREQRLSR
jgi:hypothetical protein